MDWSRIKTGTDGQVKIPESWVYIHYYEAFNLLFRIENSIRVFAYCVLKTCLGPRWLEANISTDESTQGTIGGTGKRRLAQANQFKYLGYVSPCPLLYLSMGELVELMFSEAYWRHFASYFPGKKEIMRAKLDEIIVIRNSFAHFRPLREDDIDVIRQNAKHVLLGIEGYLSNLTQCDDIVPSNSSEGWYKELATIGSENISVQLRQSVNQEWVEIRATFTSPIIKQTLSEHWVDAKVIRLDTPNILSMLPQLKERVVYLTEGVGRTIRDNTFAYWKNLHFVFTRSALNQSGSDIAACFRELVSKISGELELLQQDDLARGDLLSVVEIYGYWQAPKDEGRVGSWQFGMAKVESPPRDNDPPEYWGDLGWLGAEFVTRRHKYPWMPSSISGQEFF